AKAEAIGIRAATINSTNLDQWRQVEAELAAGQVDLLLISPGGLHNHQGPSLPDWGPRLRPDYRRLVGVLDDLDPNIPVLACTATANERVMADVAEQLGAAPLLFRGSLDRESLRLSVLTIPSQAERLAWLAEYLPQLSGSGIVYCLTVGAR